MPRLILTAAISALAATAWCPAPVGAQTVRTNIYREPTDPQGPRALPAAPASLAVSVGYGKIEFDVNQRLAYAKATLVPLTVKVTGGGTVSSLQTGGVSLLVGPQSGGLEQSIPNVDLRQILSGREAEILQRCNAILGYNQVESSAESAFDVQLAFTVNAPTGAVVASTTVPYQLGLTCKRIPPLVVTIGYTKLEYTIGVPLANARVGLASLTVKYNGPGNAVSLQGGGVSLLLGDHNGSFELTLPNVDLRRMLSQEETAIRQRCQSTLDANNVNTIDTAYDGNLPMTVNASSGAVMASDTASYQIGLTCRR